MLRSEASAKKKKGIEKDGDEEKKKGQKRATKRANYKDGKRRKAESGSEIRRERLANGE